MISVIGIIPYDHNLPMLPEFLRLYLCLNDTMNRVAIFSGSLGTGDGTLVNNSHYNPSSKSSVHGCVFARICEI